MSETHVFTGAPKRDWEVMKKRFAFLSLPELDEFACPACHEEMVMDAATHRIAARTPGALIACARCVCKAKNIPYPESVEVQ